MDENDEFGSLEPIKLPRKPLVRGLSSVVANLRKMEEEKLDDDLEALHEMEMEMENSTAAPPPRPKQSEDEPPEDILVPDSQVPQPLLGGFDDEALYDSPTEEALDRDGKPLRVFKKKGQKRTTRRVNMRPTRTKRPAVAGEDQPSSDGEEEAVPETQLDITESQEDGPAGDAPSSSESEAQDKKEGKKKKPAPKEAPKEGKIKKAVKKVSELAHANFKRLKLRNHGAKGGPGHNSRFKRRR